VMPFFGAAIAVAGWPAPHSLVSIPPQTRFQVLVEPGLPLLNSRHRLGSSAGPSYCVCARRWG
jgi:hypothetical protein